MYNTTLDMIIDIITLIVDEVVKTFYSTENEKIITVIN